jgi:alpha-ketoglutarate-dependent taurine dioxygenase
MGVPVSEVLASLVAVVDATAMPDVRRVEDARDWVTGESAQLTALLHRHGAVLLRGLPIDGAEDFATVAKAIGKDDLSGYVDGNSPRSAVSDGVYTSTEYPSQYVITLHNELSYAHWWPRRLYFYCETPAPEGGETLLAAGSIPFQVLDATALARFRSVGVTYLRNLHGGAGAGRSWQQTFETDDREQVAATLSAGGAAFRWKPDGGLWIKETRPAVQIHPEAGVEVWFNQADQWHPSNHDEATRAALYRLYAEADLPLNATYGDGQPLDPTDLRTVREAFLSAAVAVAWRRGDLLVVDNLLLTHGRASYRGPRRVLVGMS